MLCTLLIYLHIPDGDMIGEPGMLFQARWPYLLPASCVTVYMCHSSFLFKSLLESNSNLLPG